MQLQTKKCCKHDDLNAKETLCVIFNILLGMMFQIIRVFS